MTRREWVALMLAARAHGAARIRAVAFDGFTVIDPRPTGLKAEEVFPGRGAEMMGAWRSRQFEYTWLRTLTGNYADFRQVTEDALVFAAASLKLELTASKRETLMAAFLDFRAWPDAVDVLQRFKEAGVRLALLSNFTEAMLNSAVRAGGMENLFDARLSTDRVRVYKPHPRAYRLALDTFHLRREEIAFAAFGGWDAAGAKRFGYPTFWVNRLGVEPEELGVAAHGAGRGLADLEAFVQARNA
jgi:2-haloacid dehalogenase